MMNILASVSLEKQKYNPTKDIMRNKPKTVGTHSHKESQGFLTGKQEHQKLQIKVKGGPSCRLMLTDGGNDGDVILGIRGIQ